MAFTQTDIDALKDAIKSGLKRIRIGNDEFEWQTTTDGLALLARMEREVNAPRTHRLAATSKGV